MNEDHNVTSSEMRIAVLIIIVLVVVGLGYVSYTSDQRDKDMDEVILLNCISLRDNSLAMIKLHEDIAAGFGGQNRPVPPAITADLAELHRLVPSCEEL